MCVRLQRLCLRFVLHDHSSLDACTYAFFPFFVIFSFPMFELPCLSSYHLLSFLGISESFLRGSHSARTIVYSRSLFDPLRPRFACKPFLFWSLLRLELAFLFLSFHFHSYLLFVLATPMDGSCDPSTWCSRLSVSNGRSADE